MLHTVEGPGRICFTKLSVQCHSWTAVHWDCRQAATTAAAAAPLWCRQPWHWAGWQASGIEGQMGGDGGGGGGSIGQWDTRAMSWTPCEIFIMATFFSLLYFLSDFFFSKPLKLPNIGIALLAQYILGHCLLWCKLVYSPRLYITT